MKNTTETKTELNYKLQTLSEWKYSEGGKPVIHGAMSPMMAAGEMAKTVGINLHHLIRVWFNDERVMNEPDEPGCHTGYDHLVIISEAKDGYNMMLFFVDKGVGYLPVALKTSDEDNIFIPPVYENYNEFTIKPDKEDIEKIFRDIEKDIDNLKSKNYEYVVKHKPITKPKPAPILSNEELEERRRNVRSTLDTIEVGDYLIRKDGSESRVTHVWDDHVQDGGGSGSFYMNSNGSASYSGSLNPGCDKSSIKYTGKKKEGLFWFFSEGIAGAGRGHDFYCNVRVWKEV